MSKKKSRAWFTCPQWNELVGSHYADDSAAAHQLGTHPKVVAQLRTGSPVARSTLLKLLRRAAQQHQLSAAVDTLIADTRPR